jgi:hypothetical protein
VEILNGLTPQDVVVTAGAVKLREGVAVTVANGASPPAPLGRTDEMAKPKG